MTVSWEIESRMQLIRKLTEVSRALTYAASLEEILQLTVDRAADLLGAERSLLMVANDDGVLTLRSSHGVEEGLARSCHLPLTESLVPRLAALLGARPESFLGVPLVLTGTIKGVLAVIRPAESTVAAQDEWLLSALADQASVALERTRLNELGALREQLIGIIGHDLRSPLNTIRLATEVLLLREGLGEMEIEMARKIARSSSMAARLVDALLDLTRSRLGSGIPIDPKPCDMNDVCRQVIDETELAYPDRPLRVDVRGDLTGLWDRDRIYQLFANLVGNAVQHGEPRSSIEVRIQGREAEVVIEVANRGEPIPPELLPFIFDAFRQGRTVHPSGSPGLGLGLFIARQIALAHGGSIVAKSSQSEGTTFSVRLPRGTTAAVPRTQSLAEWDGLLRASPERESSRAC